MQSDNPWPEMVVTWSLVFMGAAAIGALAGYITLALLIATLIMLVWQLLHVVKLESWLRQERLHPPDGYGLWGEIFDSLYRRGERHRQRRRRLAHLLGYFRESVDAVPDAAVVLREDGAMEWWNPAAQRLLGLRSPQDVGQRIDNLFRHPDFRAFLTSDRDTTSVPSPVDEEVMLEIRVIPYGNALRLLLARDVTRIHRLEVMRRDFVANITHELRTPLTVIRGVAETLEDYAEDEQAELVRPLALLNEQTRRMEQLINNLLLLSRLETSQQQGRPRPIDVEQLLESLVQEARALSRGRHEIELQNESGLALTGDESELHSAFSNLVANAVKYTPDGGKITIRWAGGAGGCRLSVADTGIGIPPQHIPRLTERFYRVDSGRAASTGGTGLGLAIVKRILSRHGAWLEIRSQPGKGSVFVCHFPAGEVEQPGARSIL